MASANNRIFDPGSMPDLWRDWNFAGDAALFSGSASWLQKQTQRLFNLPVTLISLEHIEELRKIDRTERFLEFGSMVSLNKILTLGKIVPEALALAIKSTATYVLRNTTTIGSCICRQATPEPVIAGLAALDARYEFRTAMQSRWVTAAQFSMFSAQTMFKPQECITRVRIPLESWDYTLCRDFSAKESGGSGNEFAVFLARIQKDILTDVRVIFSGTTILRDKNSELTIIGNKLPLDKKATETFIHTWQNQLASIDNRSEFQKAKLLNFIEQAILYFAY